MKVNENLFLILFVTVDQAPYHLICQGSECMKEKAKLIAGFLVISRIIEEKCLLWMTCTLAKQPTPKPLLDQFEKDNIFAKEIQQPQR